MNLDTLGKALKLNLKIAVLAVPESESALLTPRGVQVRPVVGCLLGRHKSWDESRGLGPSLLKAATAVGMWVHYF